VKRPSDESQVDHLADLLEEVYEKEREAWVITPCRISRHGEDVLVFKQLPLCPEFDEGVSTTCTQHHFDNRADAESFVQFETFRAISQAAIGYCDGRG